MDYETARQLLIVQGMATAADEDGLLTRLKQGHPPVPGQVTSILLALKVVFEALHDASSLDRELAAALYLLSSESRQQFERGRKTGVAWPPLLDEDLTRITTAVKSIFIGRWQG
ncbi:Dethiobiotin synthetase [Leptothermofonsia sichuanensis E412]|uniref:Dethiobiotin synthetase n=1 Tax=Leptothermofonsia sichuanensis TaxID=2917832 RepID=UPI001CA69473|nr:Dethiobiotin synthetase [Leptothermofonsia sichuanensis]QZZ21317.1 Dethiobiotin synthetase [Leptothermofonsia sichuanensis E412]